MIELLYLLLQGRSVFGHPCDYYLVVDLPWPRQLRPYIENLLCGALKGVHNPGQSPDLAHPLSRVPTDAGVAVVSVSSR